MSHPDSYWLMIWKQFYKNKLGRIALFVVILFCVIGIYAPFLAASKPFVVQYDGEWFFPLFRYLFYRGYYTKGLDLFFNLLIFTTPIAIALFFAFYKKPKRLLIFLVSLILIQLSLFIYFVYSGIKDPAFDRILTQKKQVFVAAHLTPNWNNSLKYMTPYAKLNLIINYQQKQIHHERLKNYAPILSKNFPSLWQSEKNNEEMEIKQYQKILKNAQKNSPQSLQAKASIDYLLDRRQWLNSQLPLLKYEINPLIRPFHWEDDAGGNQSLNHSLPFWELTRINRKDLTAALIFGVRISLVVGFLAISIALAIGIPIGAFAGYYGGTFDILVSRLLEIWETLPTFFMLLMIIAMTQSKSIFVVITIIGIFGWTTFSRYIRGEFFKQRNLPYTEACKAIGLPDSSIIFSHILPNAIPPLLTLLPFAIMGAITSEAGLSFLGLGEDDSCSWGVIMDEGRTAFPNEAYLLWPPAILLTTLLVAIALVGDAFRDALDPKMHR